MALMEKFLASQTRAAVSGRSLIANMPQRDIDPSDQLWEETDFKQQSHRVSNEAEPD